MLNIHTKWELGHIVDQISTLYSNIIHVHQLLITILKFQQHIKHPSLSPIPHIESIYTKCPMSHWAHLKLIFLRQTLNFIYWHTIFHYNYNNLNRTKIQNWIVESFQN
jgi:hypothetical protein